MPPPSEIVSTLRGKLEDGYVRVGAARTSVLLAVSGGADSMVLLDASCAVAARLRLRLEVACVDHGLRVESAEEVAAVEREALARGVPFHGIVAAVPPGAGVEARARELRYAALERVRVERKLDAIATAHTASDQAETLLMRLGRGSALGGAAGVLPRRAQIVRPMLACTRAEVEAYARARSLPVMKDPMNEDLSFTRVRVRKQVVPALTQALGAGAEEALARFAAFAREDDALLEELAIAARQRLERAGGLDAVGLRAVAPPLRRRIWACLLAEQALPADAALLERMERALDRGGSATLPAGASLHCEGGLVRVVTAASSARGFSISWHPDRPATSSPAAHLHPLVSDVDGAALTVRTRLAGDRVQLPDGHTRKLQDLLTDARVPREQRDAVRVLVDASSRIHCVVGVWPLRGTALSGWILAEPL